MMYWHMQLHPNDKSFNREKEILEQKKVIGLGEWLEGSAQMHQFRSEMKIGDIVLVRLGEKPIALVRVTGEFEKTKKVDKNLDWFHIRRNIEVIEFVKKQNEDFPSIRGTLKKSINRYTPTYQYINNLYNKVVQSDSIQAGIKIRKIFIDSFKMFHKFSINFLDSENHPQPIIVIAGINGSGKTSLLEYIENFDTTPKFDFQDTVDIVFNGKNLKICKDSKKKQTFGIRNFKKNIIYLPIDFGNIESLEKKIKVYIDELMFEKDFKASEAYKELQNNMDEIFIDLDLPISFSGLDKNKNIFFKNAKGNKIGINELSTGEKTLLTKVLYLYLSEIKNKVILIDEPEISLHPTWQNSILKIYENFAKRNNNQIFIATHSPHILASAKSSYIRLLTINEHKIDVIDNLNKSYGLEFSKVLTDIMEVDCLRTPDVEKKIKKIKSLIISNNFGTDYFLSLWNDLENCLSSDDLDLKLLNVEMNMRKKNAKNI